MKIYSMYKWILFILLCLSGCDNSKQPDPPMEKQTILANAPGVFNSFFAVSDSLKRNRSYELLETHNSSLKDSIIKYREAFFLFPDTQFQSLHIAISADKRFGIISWDTGEGGTMIDFHAVALYKTAKGMRHYVIQQIENDDTIPSLIAYDTVVSLKSGYRTIYMGRGFGRGSTALLWENLMAFEIGDDTLFLPSIFPKPSDDNTYTQVIDYKDYIPELGVEFDIHDWSKKSGIPDERPIILFKDNNTLLMVPLVSSKEKLEFIYHSLKFDGRHFIPVRSDNY